VGLFGMWLGVTPLGGSKQSLLQFLHDLDPPRVRFHLLSTFPFQELDQVALASHRDLSVNIACALVTVACASAAIACSPAARALALTTGSGGLAFVLWDNRNGGSAGRLGPSGTGRLVDITAGIRDPCRQLCQ
jgi:hypothetical protein